MSYADQAQFHNTYYSCPVTDLLGGHYGFLILDGRSQQLILLGSQLKVILPVLARLATDIVALLTVAPGESPLLPLRVLPLDHEHGIPVDIWGLARGHGWLQKDCGDLYCFGVSNIQLDVIIFILTLSNPAFSTSNIPFSFLSESSATSSPPLYLLK